MSMLAFLDELIRQLDDSSIEVVSGAIGVCSHSLSGLPNGIAPEIRRLASDYIEARMTKTKAEELKARYELLGALRIARICIS